ncbi:MAG TPA: DUF4388 domain-containing protein [Vicinamibacteria bacterium]|nr:DUF4388 domain-containing protein [Vicinamibacteria bacterium]
MDKVLEGSVGRFEVPEVLTFLHMGKRSGALVLERPDQETKLFFREGNPVFATSTRPELRLGTLLVRMGKVSEPVLHQSLDRHRAAGHRVGQALLADKILSESELSSFLKVQVSEVIFDTFVWKDGVFSFWDGVPAPATAVTLQMELQNLLMEGSRRTDERGRLKEIFPDHQMVVEAVANPERVKQSVTLTPEEWKVFFLVDGRRTIADMLRLADNPDELATLEVLRHLVVAKFVNVVPALPAPADAAPDAVIPPAGTHMEAQAGPPAEPVSVSFRPSDVVKRDVAMGDDTKEIVTPKAVQYVGRAARKVTVSRLVLLGTGLATETAFPLNRDTHTIGRHRNNDIVIADPKVSSFHARVDRTPEGFVVVDLKSRNGTFVNGKKIETALLETGAEVRLGTARLRYVLDFVSEIG